MKKTLFFFALAVVAGGLAFGQANRTITNDDIVGDVTFSSDTTYTLQGYVFVDSLETLTIEPGTVILGTFGAQENATALVVKRGGKIMAEGTSTEPIVFTSTSDEEAGFDLPVDVDGEWGGVIILGSGLTNNQGYANEIEGIPPEYNAHYGGEIEDDNSGMFKFVSIRHAGVELAPDEEINGLTLGAVGSKSTFSYVEVVANQDDGIEWFGGSPRLDHIIVVNVGDESFDWDEGVRFYGQYFAAVQTYGGVDKGDNVGEHDGAPSNNRDAEHIAHPMVSNVTYIGRTDNTENMLVMRENTGGEYHNSIMLNGKGINIGYVEGETDSWYQLDEAGTLMLKNNIFYGTAGDVKDDILKVYAEVDGQTVPTEVTDKIKTYFDAWGNTIADPGVTWDNLIPTGDVSGTSYEGLPAWFNRVGYKGAFNPAVTGIWAGGWTKTYADIAYNPEEGIVEGMNDQVKSSGSATVFPNPIQQYATVSFENPGNERFSFMVYSLSGQAVMSIEDITGSQFEFSRTGIKAGVYLYLLKGERNTFTGKMIVN